MSSEASRSTAAAEPAGADFPRAELSVIVLNYNGARWIKRCLESLRMQTIFARLEVIVADNASTDGSDAVAAAVLASWPGARFVQHGSNLGFCEGNNRAAREAQGDYLLFLNNDTWLEPSCLETLLRGVEAEGAAGGTPLILDYDGDNFQSLGAAGFDLFGFASPRRMHAETRAVLMPEGSAFLLRRELFEQLGGFPAHFFMYAEEYDLAFRVWVAGHKLVAVPAARMHHRGGAQVNPSGGGQVVEFRTSDRVRFYSNRNGLLVLLQNAQHGLLLLAALQTVWLVVESLVCLLLLRDLGFVRRAYWRALADCWRLRPEIQASRRRVAGFRKRGDLWMLGFLGWRLNRVVEWRKIRRLGLPKVSRGSG